MQNLSAQTRLLVVAPHPDDETLATGVLIQRVLAAGGTVHVLLLTDGDNNPWPQRWLERRWWIGARARERWAHRRRGEFAAALRELGIPGGGSTALGWPDQGLTRLVGRALTASTTVLGEVLATFAPTLVAMPALDDRHPDHSAAHVLMRLALDASAARPAIWLYRVHGTSGADVSSIACPASVDMAARKQAALAHHASQLALSGQRMQRLAAREETYECLDAPRSCDRLPWSPPWIARAWFRLVAAGRGDGAVWRWTSAPLERPASGGLRLRSGMPSGGAVFVKLELALPCIWIFDHWGWCELRP
jgi:LmbE family N-acetylglucosaminyl deacetylase